MAGRIALALALVLATAAHGDPVPAKPAEILEQIDRLVRTRFYAPELFRETAERIPGARLRLYQDKGHVGVITHKPAIREIVAFLRDDQPPT